MPQSQPMGMVEAECRFCRGSGKDPYRIMSELADCPVCLGRGKTVVPRDNVPCAHCRGSGSISSFTCTVCGGHGVVAAPSTATATCPVCGGSGDDPSSGNMACLKCKGKGYLVD